MPPSRMGDDGAERPGRQIAAWGAGGIVLALVLVIVFALAFGGHSGGSRSNGSSSATSTPGGPPPTPGQVVEQYGASVNRLFNDLGGAPAEVAAQLRALRATGATIARSDSLWELTEPAAPNGGTHHYNWAFDDAIAGALAQAGLRWFPLVDYAPAWAQASPGGLHAPPISALGAAGFAAYAAAIAGRYGSQGTFWTAHPGLPAEPVDTYEIWNEPDNPTFWTPAPNPGAYALLYLRARAAVRQADPTARVIIGGLTNVAVFLPAMVHAVPALVGHVDGIGIHPYGTTPGDVLASVATARRITRTVGLGGVPLDLTEFGWTTSPPGVQDWAPANLRPQYILASLAHLGHTDCALGAAILYTWMTPERRRADPEDWFGIHPPSGADSPDTRAFSAGIAAARAAPASRLCG